MSTSDKRLIAHLQKQLEQYQQQAQQTISALIAERDQLKRQVERSNMLTGYHAAGMGDLENKIDQLQQERDYFKNEVHRLMSKYALVEIVSNGDAIVNIDDDNREKYALIVRTETTPVTVAYVVTYKDTSNPDFIGFITGQAMYQGEMKQLEQDVIGRAIPVLWLAPTLDDLRAPYLDKYGIDNHTLMRFMNELSLFWHDDIARERYKERFDVLFDNKIAPHVKNRRALADCKTDLHKCIENTFKAMGDRRNTRADKPKLRGKK